jgi:hypothetical protein
MPAPVTEIKIGTSWTGSNGRTWEVYEILPFGRARIRSGMRFGEMYHRDIRAVLAAQASS